MDLQPRSQMCGQQVPVGAAECSALPHIMTHECQMRFLEGQQGSRASLLLILTCT